MPTRTVPPDPRSAACCALLVIPDHLDPVHPHRLLSAPPARIPDQEVSP